uniref:Uncharacterized protein n=1 Tax=Rhizophagus irregularis (strain DAOM 181602 / DAOM 197198 / MUCL 43194) TaxID=747089 RepID=U9SWZ8_RHIID
MAFIPQLRTFTILVCSRNEPALYYYRSITRVESFESSRAYIDLMVNTINRSSKTYTFKICKNT